jgi:hypothetical protein
MWEGNSMKGGIQQALGEVQHVAVQKEWMERQSILFFVAHIMDEYQFDDNGLCKNPDKYKRCNLAAIYFAMRADDGDGDEDLWANEGGTVHTIFEPDALERAILGLTLKSTTDTIYYDSWCNSQGFVFGRELLQCQVDELRAKAHSDNPDDEIEDDEEKDTPRHGEHGGEIDF